MGISPQSMQELRPYVVAWRRRRGERAHQLQALCAETNAALPAVVELLVGEYGARRVLLFGSLARGGFGPGSDVDLLVEGGLEGTRLFAAGARIEALLPAGVGLDLVPWEAARAEILERALEEGRLLHGTP